MKSSLRRFFCLALLMAVPFAAAVADTVGYGSFTRVLPSGKTGPQQTTYKTENVQAPLPTNEWWSSLISNVPDSNAAGTRLFAYPLVYRCDTGTGGGLMIGLPAVTRSGGTVSFGNDGGDPAPYRQQLLVQGTYNGTSSVINTNAVKVDGYGDYSVRALWKDTVSGSSFTATMGQGFIFTYFNFSENVNAKILFPAEWGTGQFVVYRPNDLSTPVTAGTTISDTNRLVIVYEIYGDSDQSHKRYYSLYVPTGSQIKLDNNGSWNVHVIDVTFPSGAGADDRYMSIGIMSQASDITEWSKHDDVFITNTRVLATVNQDAGTVDTSYEVDTNAKDSGIYPLLAAFPHQHQWSEDFASNYARVPSVEFATLRGPMWVIRRLGYTVTNEYRGILPMLPERGSYDKNVLLNFLSQDKTQELTKTDTYFHGKELCRLANLIPIASQMGDTVTKEMLIRRLREDLVNWYTYTGGETNRFFYYDGTWGGFIGYDNSFGSENFTDQHFHFGYFVYASAILAMYDPSFAEQYGGMVEMVIQSFANPFRHGDTGNPCVFANYHGNDVDFGLFPFMRTFSPYEGHSWADGRGIAWDGNNQESSSEAMNSWAGIYLWGLATDKSLYRDLGIWGYTTEYSAVKYYYCNNMSDTNKVYPPEYTSKNVGILWGGKVEQHLWFTPIQPETLHGIQILPVNPSMLYLGYDVTYAQDNYAEMRSEKGGADENLDKWYDIFWRYQALFDPSSAITKFNMKNSSINFDEASSRSYTYYWLHDFNAMGRVDTTVYADAPAFNVFDKLGTKTYVAYNPAYSSRTVHFRNRSNGALAGTMTLPARSMVSTTDFSSFKTESTLTPLAGLRVSSVSAHVVDLAWDNVSNARYVVARSTDNTSWSTVVSLNQGYRKNSFHDGLLHYGTTCYYMVYSYDGYGRMMAMSSISAVTRELPANAILVPPSAADRVMIDTNTVTGPFTVVLPANSVPFDSYMTINPNAQNASGVGISGARLPAGRVLVNGSVIDVSHYDYYGSTVPLGFPARLMMHYPDADGDGVIDGSPVQAKVADLKVFVYNPVTRNWDLVPGTQTIDPGTKAIAVTLRHFSYYALMTTSPAENDLSKVSVYPNPYRPRSGSRFDDSGYGKGVVFNHLTQRARVRIFTIAGELVADLTNDAGEGLCLWNGKNQAGEEVASGVYIFIATNPEESGQKATGKIAVIK